MQSIEPLRWQKRLEKELSHRPAFNRLTEESWCRLLLSRRVSSSNQDTILALDWPHFCGNATDGCGGLSGWCYTFQGNQASRLHDRHVAMVDVLARRFPELFAEKVAEEVNESVGYKQIRYPNIRYSGSGEVSDAHIPALKCLTERGVHLWGFTRNLRVAERLRGIGAAVIVSCDKTSPIGFARVAAEKGFPLAYTSAGVSDVPPHGTIVTFPVHRIGRVREVVDVENLCPKVVADFLDDARERGTCQAVCNRCHLQT